MVGAARFELATPSPPDWCANRAALRSAKGRRANEYAGRSGSARLRWSAGLQSRTRRRTPGSSLPIARRHRHQAPQSDEDQEIVPPMIPVDDDAFAGDTDEGDIDRLISSLPGARDEDETPAGDEGHQRQRQIGRTRDPTAGDEGV